ncbi:carboxylesterase/lipase family protein [Microbacterium sp. Root553]|uniref:carboxylesterase/lipase family protein n=1 Tax=Microbacterium sp. Root553 TaxID=1736556 RepID=UPI00138EFE89|nr:carboxylesterase family protein [Microbacterium sp. Root553]
MGRSIAIAVLTAIGGLFAWLNDSPWWAWGLAGVPVALTAIVLALPLMRRRWLRATAWTLGAALTVTAAISAGPAVQAMAAVRSGVPSTSTVDTTEGPVAGVIDGNRAVEVFAGIPYAKPPVGDLRWQAPERPSVRKGIFHADHFSDIAMQDGSDFLTRALPKIIPFPLRPGLRNTSPMSEDALTLNIWRSTRPSTEKRPILVYIHGGGFRSGSSAVPLYDGANLASHGDAIVVTINYRLGVFGYLSHPDLAAESPEGVSGNFGTLDQLAALRWIDENAAAFGGDNTRVTIAGESAGGEAVCILGATRLAAGLVDGIIGESGACMGTTGDVKAGDQGDTRAVAEQAGERLSDQLDMSIAEMRELPAEELQRAAADLAEHWRPSVDGHVLTRSPVEIYARGEQLDVPHLLGSNADEASLGLAVPLGGSLEDFRRSAHETYGDDAEEFLRLYPATEENAPEVQAQADTDRVMTAAMYRWAQLHGTHTSSPTFLYFFSHVPPDPRLQHFGAYHGAEVLYAYDNLEAGDDARYGADDYALRDQMSTYWLNFVKTGDPNGDSLPAWPRFTDAPDQVMEFDHGSRVAPRPQPEQVDFWMKYTGPVA